MSISLVKSGKECAYCGKPTVYVDSIEVYRKSYGMIYLCRPCKAWVGVHDGTDKALGRVANAELRGWKKKVHSVFDPVWKSGKRRRASAYHILANLMAIPPDECHIGMFDVDLCKRACSIILSGALD